MEPFVKLFQPDRYPNWMLGKDSTPIDHTHATPSTTPELQSWLQRRHKTKLANAGYSTNALTFFFLLCVMLLMLSKLQLQELSNDFADGHQWQMTRNIYQLQKSLVTCIELIPFHSFFHCLLVPFGVFKFQ